MKKQFVCLKVCFRVCFQVAATAAAEPRRVSARQFFDKVRWAKLEFFFKIIFLFANTAFCRNV